MNANVIMDEVLSALQKRYGKCRQISRAQVFTFNSAFSASLNYSKLLGGHKYFYAIPSMMLENTTEFPSTTLGEFSLLVCGSADKVLVIPRSIILEMLQGVRSRRIDVFCESGTYILQTTKHPKLDVTEFLNAFPTADKPAKVTSDDIERTGKSSREHVRIRLKQNTMGSRFGEKTTIIFLCRAAKSSTIALN